MIRINLEQGGQIERSAAIVASWARYDEGTDEQGNPIDVVDHPVFVAAYAQALDGLHSVGARAALESLRSRS